MVIVKTKQAISKKLSKATNLSNPSFWKSERSEIFPNYELSSQISCWLSLHHREETLRFED
jgi:hypothetical protein